MISIRHKILILLMTFLMFNSFGELVGKPNIKYGPSQSWSPRGTTKENLEKLKKRTKELRDIKKKLLKKKRKTKGKDEKEKVQKEIEAVVKELKKVFDDFDFEDDLTTDPRKPKRKEEARVWKLKMRALRLEKLKKEQKKWDEKQKKKRSRAQRVSDLMNLGDVTIGEVSSANQDVIEAQRELSDVEDEINRNNCDVSSDENQEICIELGSARTEASALLEQKQYDFSKIAKSIPPLLLGGGSLYVFYDRMKELQDSYRKMRDIKRELIQCKEDCDVVKRQVENIKNSLQEQQSLDKEELFKIQDELKKEDMDDGELDVKLVIPTYLSEKTEIPFGNRNELPIIVALDSIEEESVVKSGEVVINGELIELAYYPERKIFTGYFTGFPLKTDFLGKVRVELQNDQILLGEFKGRINGEDPLVEIVSDPGSLFRKGKFHVTVTGEFDKIQISGKNIKEQTLVFQAIKKYHKMTIKAQKKGTSSIKVVATRTSKNVKMPNFNGETLLTDEEGRILREDDFFQEINLDKGKSNELGFCCEDKNSLTCEGCYSGKRTRKSCKDLNKLPGFNFKAFLVAKTLKCTKL